MADDISSLFASGNVSPGMLRALQRYRFGDQLAKGATNQDATNGIGVLAKVLQGALGGYLQNGAVSDAQETQRGIRDTQAQAERALSGFTNPDTGELMMPGSQQQYYNVLESNPDTAGRALTERAADRKRLQDYNTDLGKKLIESGVWVNPMTGALEKRPEIVQARGEAARTMSFNQGLGSGLADVATKPELARAMIAPKVEEEYALNAPKAQGASLTAWAQNPALVARAGGVKSAEESAALPFVGPKAEASAYGSALGTSNANLSSAPQAPGVPAGMTRAAAGAFANETGQQSAQMPFVQQRAQAAGRGQLGAELEMKPRIAQAMSPIEAQSEAAKIAATTPGLVQRQSQMTAAQQAAELPFVGPMSQARTAGTLAAEAAGRPAVIAAETPGLVARQGQMTAATQAAEQPFIGPRAAAQARGTLTAEAEGRPLVIDAETPARVRQAGAMVAPQAQLARAEAAARTPYQVTAINPGGTLLSNARVLGGNAAPAAGAAQEAQAAEPGIYQDPRPAPNTQAGKIEDFLAERFVGTQKAGETARKSNAQLDRLNILLDDVDTGKFKGTTTELKAAMKGLGFDPERFGIRDDVGVVQAAQALSNGMALDLRDPSSGSGLPGSMSDYDVKLLQSMSPGIGVTREGRMLMSEGQKLINKRNAEVAEFARQYARDRGGRIDLSFDDEVTKKFGDKPLFGEDFAKKVDVLNQASQAIARGADPAAVRKRLKEKGF